MRLVHSARASRAVERPVTCEECGTRYVYVLEREARVYGFSSILDHLTGRARQRAEEFAERALERKLRLACEVAPCPKCGHVQRDMVREARRRHLRWLRRTGWWFTALVVAVGVCNRITEIETDEPRLMSWSLFLGLLAIGPGLILVHTLLASAHDPNDEHPEARLARAREVSVERPSGGHDLGPDDLDT